MNDEQNKTSGKLLSRPPPSRTGCLTLNGVRYGEREINGPLRKKKKSYPLGMLSEEERGSGVQNKKNPSGMGGGRSDVINFFFAVVR